ncbi:MAG: outer membrane beta-barrel protein [Thermodesulfobacteriota bacterium]
MKRVHVGMAALWAGMMLLVPVAMAAEEAAPVGSGGEALGQAKGGSDWFGPETGYIHPFLSLTQAHTDNLYNNQAKASDFYNIITPGVWLAVPASKEELAQFNTSSLSPGGLAMSNDKTRAVGRYQAYLAYNADIYRYHDKTDENVTDHKTGAFFQYNFRGGLSFDFVNKWTRGHDPRGTGTSETLDKFKTNLFGVLASYELTKRFELQAEYDAFKVNYDNGRDERDRDDDTYGLSLHYKFSPKTTFLAEYKVIDVDYDQTTYSDSTEDQFLAGIKWEATGKSSLRLKAGYGSKDFEQAGKSDADNLVVELSGRYAFTPKTSLEVTGSRKANETTIEGTSYVRSDTVTVAYLQQITPRIAAVANLIYTNDSYDGIQTGETKERDDDVITFAPALQYSFNKWLFADLVYSYTKRDSNFDQFDYETNQVMVRLASSF